MNLELLNILLADDDTDDCLFFKKALKELQLNTNLTTVNDGEQLMEYLSENLNQLPDVLFLDLSMPRKTGFECLVEITENENYKGIYIVMFSTSFRPDPIYEQDMINRLLKLGAHNFIRKPGDFDQLKKIIQRLLKGFMENNSRKIRQ